MYIFFPFFNHQNTISTKLPEVWFTRKSCGKFRFCLRFWITNCVCTSSFKLSLKYRKKKSSLSQDKRPRMLLSFSCKCWRRWRNTEWETSKFEYKPWLWFLSIALSTMCPNNSRHTAFSNSSFVSKWAENVLLPISASSNETLMHTETA